MWNVFRRQSVSSKKLTEPHLASFNFPSFKNHKPPLSALQLCYTGEKLSYHFSVESFEFLTPSKICFTYDSPYKLCEKVIAKHTRGLKLILNKEVPWRFTWRPQRAIRPIGASDPPLYSCKKLERSLKGNPDFDEKQFPPSHTHPSISFQVQIESGKVSKKSVKCPKSPCFKASTRTRIRKCGSESGPGIKIRAKVAQIQVPSPYPANNGLDPDSFFLSLCFFF